LYEYAQAQQSTTTSRPANRRRPLSDKEIDVSNRRTAWTLGIVVVAFLAIAVNNHHAREILRMFGFGFF
jgi:hypothetical protein